MVVGEGGRWSLVIRVNLRFVSLEFCLLAFSCVLSCLITRVTIRFVSHKFCVLSHLCVLSSQIA